MKKWTSLLAVFIFSSILSAKEPFQPVTMVVAEPVVDVRSEPSAHAKMYQHDPFQETQLTKGETVRVLEKRGRWARVECLEQPEFTHNNRWEGYPGWVRWKALSRDLSKKQVLPPIDPDEKVMRARILEAALLHTGSPYLWGGRSLYEPDYKKNITGVDCSGLVNGAFRAAGWIIPRDAHEQYMKARRIEPKEAKPGDLIFLAKEEKPDKIVHVAFYLGDNQIFEAPQTGEVVRKISAQDRFGAPVEGLQNGMKVKDRIIYFGSYFPYQPESSKP